MADNTMYDKKKLLIKEWDKVTKPLLLRLEQLKIDIPFVCSDGRKGDEEWKD